MGQLRHAMICSSNVNRSVAAHALIKDNGFEVESFGVGKQVKLPGLTADAPNRYAFGQTTYEDIYIDLTKKDEGFYRSNGLIQMMERDMKVKKGPQRWQDRTVGDGLFDVIVTFEKRVMDMVVADLEEKTGSNPCLVINLDVKDSVTEAVNAAPHALKLCQLIEDSDDWEADIDSILEQFAKETGRQVPEYEVCFQ